MRDKTYTVDLNTKVYSVPIYKQFDNLIPFSIKLIEDGKEIDLSGYTALAFFQNDKVLIQKNCIINDNIVKAILDNNILALPGLIKVEFQFRKNQEIVTTFQMKIQVEESLDKENAIESTPQWDLLGQAIIDITNSINDINETKENLINDINTNISTLNSKIDSSVDTMIQDINVVKENLVDDISELTTKVDERVALEIFDGDYNSLINKPTKVSDFENDAGYITSSDIDSSQNHVHTNKAVLDGITQDKVTSWDSKSNFDGNYNSLTNKPTKVSDFENDAGYITNSDIDTSQNHVHSNKIVLDEITQDKVVSWDAKTNFDGDYNSLINKPNLTSKAVTGLNFWVGTQAEYDSVDIKDATTLYLIKEE
ncbi:phage upper tail fiber protein [Clostridioides difficile]|uniref:phage upper tail fiber protein n=1 Tax=Clostridioides difficile TaxID=1496 RepID=UPI0010332A5C|nr:hypothetical protein [Clostridioides difficile]MDX5761199.1 hypothetical protein [Clostridioides difficile]HBG1033756.1 hypothetical protein [Clostridioides difficile]HBH1594084.1 hypothetical protein [Clostridioides difficile]